MERKMKKVTGFSVNGLFGYRNFQTQFNNRLTVFVGENGFGKTTIMRCFFYLLKKDYGALAKIPFNDITIIFENEFSFKIEKEAVIQYVGGSDQNHRRRVPIENDEVTIVIQIIREYLLSIYAKNPQKFSEIVTKMVANREFQPIFHLIKIKGIPLPPEIFIKRYMKRVYMDIREDVDSGQDNIPKKLISLLDYNTFVNKNLNDLEILYFPTYRRLPDDLNKVLEDSNLSDDNRISQLLENDIELIKFGMKDVKESIDSILEKIRKQSLEAFNDLNTEILKQYTSTDKISSRNEINIDFNKLDIVLSRLGDRIDDDLKLKLKNQIQTDENHMTTNNGLLKNYVKLLLDSYTKSEPLEEQIDLFITETNKFLEDKKFDYDPATLEISLKFQQHKSNKSNLQEVNLQNLSSGEKQIVSIFARIFLNKSENLYVFFDEPELSLSIAWQEKLLPSILHSPSINYLLAITHSPFIFRNPDIRSKAIYMEATIKDN